MELEVIFESWHVPDGNYPPLSKNEFIHLAYEIEDDYINKTNDKILSFQKVEIATYKFTAKVIGVCKDDGGPALIIFDTENFKFYINSPNLKTAKVNEVYEGQGTLVFDHFAWFENYKTYKDAPWIFYKFKVIQITKVLMPEKLIHKTSNSCSFPARLEPDEIRKAKQEHILSMEDEDFDTEFYILQLSDKDIPNIDIPFTFFDY